LDGGPLAEGFKDQKVANLRLNLHGTILEAKSIGSNRKKINRTEVKKEGELMI
jgi:hypothetical protein